MCGILFQLHKSGREFSAHEQDRFAEALELMAHRGPDNRTVRAHGNAMLGHARLSIIDLSDEANQPFERGPFSLIFNGEIYNYVELRQELKRAGRSFETSSDTEVLIQAWEEWGPACCQRLNGMWAFIILNRETGEWHISRDRFGQKPLSVFEGDDRIIVSSEMAPIRHLAALKPDWGNVGNFVLEGQPARANASFYEGVSTFPKAHSASLNASGQLMDKQRYWRVYQGQERSPTDGEIEEFNELIKDAVRLRLRSDVPVGILLSGGLDSTIVADKIRELNAGANVTAYSYSYKNQFDEIEHARTIANRFNMPIVTGNDGDKKRSPQERLGQLRDIVRHMGRLHHSPAILAGDDLYGFARSHGSIVVMDGQGSDELLAGYETYHIPAILDYVREGNFREAGRIFQLWRKHGFMFRLVRYARQHAGTRFRRLMRRIYGYGKLVVEMPESPRNPSWDAVPDPHPFRSRLNRHLAKQHDYMLENLLFYGDIMAMISP